MKCLPNANISKAVGTFEVIFEKKEVSVTSLLKKKHIPKLLYNLLKYQQFPFFLYFLDVGIHPITLP
jgi:hypothetical protein